MIEAAVLVGGKGTRLKSVVADRPKPMAEVAGRPFLEWLLLAIRAEGVQRAVLCTGYLGQFVSDYFGDGSRIGLELAYSFEPAPLGTGGALRLALNQLGGANVLALNGDSFCRFSIAQLVGAHEQSAARATLWLAPVADTGRYGSVEVDAGGAVRAFREKGAAAGPGLINAGVYLLRRECLEALPAGQPASLERELFPSLIGRGLFATTGEGTFIDIGLPETYAAAGQVLSDDLARLVVAGPG